MTADELIKKFQGIIITDEMKQRAKEESQKRESDIMHHFHTDSFTQEQTDQIGFYGEFAFRKILGIDWKEGVRADYKTIDSSDLNINNWAIDVKTESIPEYFIWQVLDKSIRDNDWYGRRLFHTGQQRNLEKYDLVMMGSVKRENIFADIDAWFPIGWAYANKITDYPSGRKGPLHHNGKKNIWYPFSGFQITTTDLKPVSDLEEIIQHIR
tara:strand:- start:4087 stop:4719 length:633 start_codon:yes stop_codon:yes gene_type:complete